MVAIDRAKEIDATRPAGVSSISRTAWPATASNGKGDPQGQYPPVAGIDKKLTREEVDTLIADGQGRHAVVRHALGDGSARSSWPTCSETSPKPVAPGEDPPDLTGRPTRTPATTASSIPNGYPAVKPPWGTLNAIDLNTGRDRLDRSRSASCPSSRSRACPRPAPRTTAGPSSPRAASSSSRATKDEKFRAFDKTTGELLLRDGAARGRLRDPEHLQRGRQAVRGHRLRAAARWARSRATPTWPSPCPDPAVGPLGAARVQNTGHERPAGVGPSPRGRGQGLRAAQAAPGRALEGSLPPRRRGLHLGHRALRHRGGRGARPAHRGALLRRGAALPPHPPAQPAVAGHLRHLAAPAPGRARLLPPVPGRHPVEPRRGAPDPALRLRRLAPAPDREGPRAAAPPREDPVPDHRTPSAPTSRCSGRRPSSAGSPCASAFP